jgi:hypothetical protein
MPFMGDFGKHLKKNEYQFFSDFSKKLKGREYCQIHPVYPTLLDTKAR